MGADRERLRTTFGEDAERYQRCRPGYPPELFDDLSELAQVGPGARVLEIGCGMGQATEPLAWLGCSIVGVELSTGMATAARRRLAGFPAVRLEVSAFEDWPLSSEPFDVVLSATAFGWVDPAVRMTKASDALRPGGALAVISTAHVAGGTVSSTRFSSAATNTRVRDTPKGLRLPDSADVPAESAEFDASRRFGPVEFRRYEWEQTYRTDEYLDLLLTYSSHRVLAPAIRGRLLACIADLIDDAHDGRITKRYMTQLAVARRA